MFKYSENQETVEQEDDNIKAIFKCLGCCYRVNSYLQ